MRYQTQKKYRAKHMVSLTSFYYSLDHVPKFARRCEETEVEWTNVVRYLVHDAVKAELKKYNEHLKEHKNDEFYKPFADIPSNVRAREHFKNLKNDYKAEKIQLHKALHVLYQKTGKAVNPFIVWLAKEDHKLDDIKIFEHLLNELVEDQIVIEEIYETGFGKQWFKYKPAVAFRRERFNKRTDNTYVDADLQLQEKATKARRSKSVK